MIDNIIVCYRFHSVDNNDIKFKYLYSFVKQYSDFMKNNNQGILNGKFFFIIDNCSKEIKEQCRKILDYIKYEFIETESNNVEETKKGGAYDIKHYTLFHTSFDIFKKYSNENSIIFFNEDDYLFRPESISKSIAFLNIYNKDFLALQDHPNRYLHRKEFNTGHFEQNSLVHPNYEKLIDYVDGWHWRTTISTCYTFIATYQALMLNKKRFFERPQFDHTNWCSIWADGYSKLWGPVPGLASHRGGPHLDDWKWESLLDNSIEAFNNKTWLNALTDYNPLAEVVGKYTTDKNYPCHNYTRWYNLYFTPIRYNKINLLEIGYAYGNSHRAWKDFFKNAEIYSIENNIPENFDIQNDKIFIGDYADTDFLINICNKIENGFDIIIDDASHISSHQMPAFNILFGKLNKGGIYVLEDLQISFLEQHENTIDFLKNRIDDIMWHGTYHGYNDFYSLPQDYIKSLNEFEKSIETIHFYPGICFVIKRS